MSSSEPLDVKELKVACDANGDSAVTVWCTCHTAADLDDVIAWLELARKFMQQWEQRRAAE